MKVILISGKAQNGKDTVAAMIRNKLKASDKKVLVTHYADLLKYICKNYFEWNGRKDENGRKMLQHVGTDLIRKQNPNFWVNFVANILKYFNDYWDYVIIPDCRFPNEIEMMRDSGFDIIHWRVLRPDYDNKLTESQKNHLSETALDNFGCNCLIINNSTLEELKERVSWLVDSELLKGEGEDA